MPQTLRTANDIIVKSFYLIGEISPDELPSGSQVTEALYYLNDLFDHFSSLGIFIPFVKDLTFNLQAGKDKYTISNVDPADIVAERIVELDYVNVVRDNISYPVRIVRRSDVFNNTRLVNLTTRPGTVILERDNQVTTLQFYPVPDFTYECNVRAKFMLDHLELFDDIEEIPPYYFRFLRYALGRELLNVYPSANWSDRAEAEYQAMYRNITAANDLDMSIFPSNILMSKYGGSIYESFGVSP